MADEPTTPGGSKFSADEYFANERPPDTLQEHAQLAAQFVERHHAKGRRVVLVTSGGTTVPLEQNVVRFLDNFSAGTRGATSAEYFLSAGYAVIFMHRQHSLSPYTRHYSHTTNPFLDLLAEPAGAAPDTDIHVLPQYFAQLEPVLQAYHTTRRAGTLLRIPFVTVNEYLFTLREMSRAMAPLGRNGLYYLAAAVSDFFVPSQKTPQHKIQSGKGSLSIEMDQVPKVLKPMVHEWAPEGFIVSFKLETDPALLIPKARGALQRYGHQVVIGNDLNRRKFEVVFVEQLRGGAAGTEAAVGASKGAANAASYFGAPEGDADDTRFLSSWMRLADLEGGAAGVEGLAHGALAQDDALPVAPGGKRGEKEIEEFIVAELCRRHTRWIDEGQTRNVGGTH